MFVDWILVLSEELEVSEPVIDLVVEVVEILSHLVLRDVWLLELHLSELVDDVSGISERLLNEAHGDLTVLLGAVSDDSDAVVVELNDSLHHAHGLVERAVVIEARERVLLEELILDDLGSLYTIKQKCEHIIF